MDQKIILISGATAGIGKAACAELVKTNSRIVMIARNVQKASITTEFLKNINPKAEIDVIQGDLSSLDSVREIAATFCSKYPKLDILINNAGLFQPVRRTSADGYEMTFAVNHLSNFLLTRLLLDKLKTAPSAKIITTSSAAQDYARINFGDLMAENKYSMWPVYCQSKLSNVIFTSKLASLLSSTAIEVTAFHPGYVHTEFGRDINGILRMIFNFSMIFARTPQKGAETLVWLANTSDDSIQSGKFYFDKKVKKPNPQALDPDIVNRLWSISEELTGCTY